jgi:uncharacterized protein (TIGR00299 family) protein
MHTLAYVDGHSGLRGDMLIGAFLDSGLSLQTLNHYLAAFPIDGLQLESEQNSRADLPGTAMHITLRNQEQPVGSLIAIDQLLRAAPFSAHIREIALPALRRLAHAQAAIQQMPPEEAEHTQFIRAQDCIEIVGIAVGLAALGIADLYIAPLPLTTGYTPAAHGPRPNPAPVILELLRHVQAPWQPCAQEDELITPGVAAILAAHAHFTTPALTIERVGYGHSQACPQGSLRLYLGHLHPLPSSPASEADTDWVAVLESHIDNMSGELLGGLMERLFALGALDVSYTPIQMKKNRPATKITVICSPDQGESLSLILLRETSTLGVRIQHVQRLKAQRSQHRMMTPLGEVLIKIKRLGGHIISAAPEFEACQRIAHTQHMPLADVYAVVQRSIQTYIIEMEDQDQ